MGIAEVVKFLEENQGKVLQQSRVRIAIADQVAQNITRLGISRSSRIYRNVPIGGTVHTLAQLDVVAVDDKEVYLIIAAYFKKSRRGREFGEFDTGLRRAYNHFKGMGILSHMYISYRDEGSAEINFRKIERPIDDIFAQGTPK